MCLCVMLSLWLTLLDANVMSYALNTMHSTSVCQVIDLAAPSQVESFQFQVAAEIFHSSRRQILG